MNESKRKKKKKERERETYNIEDDAHIPVVRINIALRAPEDRNGSTPSRRIRFPGKNILGYLIAGKVPDLDELLIPLYGIDATASGVETVPVTPRIITDEAAPRKLTQAAAAGAVSGKLGSGEEDLFIGG